MNKSIATYSTLGKNGRFANAAFQLAFTISYALDHNKDFVFPEWEYSKWMEKPLPIGALEDAIQIAVPFHYVPIQDYPGKNIDFRYNHAQSSKYFSHHWNEIKPYVTLKKEYRDYLLQKYGDQLKTNRTCSIHIRLGDYTQKHNREYHGSLPVSYYKKAIKEIYGDDTSDVLFFIFSDEIKKCGEFFWDAPAIFVNEGDSIIPAWKDNSGLPCGNGDLLELFLMSQCSNNIIANSSFSWWGAWMNENPNKKVVAPKNWFVGKDAPQIIKDIYCDGWITI